MMNAVVHFEMPYDDRDRVVKFYQDVFGWELQVYGPEMGNYVLVQHPKSDVVPDAVKGAIGGGFFPRTAHNTHPSLVIGVEDIKAMMTKIESSGGILVKESLEGGTEPMAIPGIGLYASFKDTEGNLVSLLQSSKM